MAVGPNKLWHKDYYLGDLDIFIRSEGWILPHAIQPCTVSALPTRFTYRFVPTIKRYVHM